MAIFGPRPWVNTLGKMSIYSFFWNSCFYRVKNYSLKKKVGKLFPKKKSWKNGHFSTKTMG